MQFIAALTNTVHYTAISSCGSTDPNIIIDFSLFCSLFEYAQPPNSKVTCGKNEVYIQTTIYPAVQVRLDWTNASKLKFHEGM